jgi:hypothetical protein
VKAVFSAYRKTAKFTLEEAMKAQRGKKGVSLLFL